METLHSIAKSKHKKFRSKEVGKKTFGNGFIKNDAQTIIKKLQKKWTGFDRFTSTKMWWKSSNDKDQNDIK